MEKYTAPGKVDQHTIFMAALAALEDIAWPGTRNYDWAVELLESARTGEDPARIISLIRDIGNLTAKLEGEDELAQDPDEGFEHEQKLRKRMFISCVCCLLAGHGDPGLMKALPYWLAESPLWWTDGRRLEDEWKGDCPSQRAMIQDWGKLTLAGWVARHEDPLVLDSLPPMAWKSANTMTGYVGVPALFFGLAQNPHPYPRKILLEMWEEGFMEEMGSRYENVLPYKHEGAFEIFPTYNDEGNTRFFEIMDRWLAIRHPETQDEDGQIRLDSIGRMLRNPPSWIGRKNLSDQYFTLNCLARKLLEHDGPGALGDDVVRSLSSASNLMGWIVIKRWQAEQDIEAVVDLARKIAHIMRNNEDGHRRYLTALHQAWIEASTDIGVEVPQSLKNAPTLYPKDPEGVKRVVLGIEGWAHRLMAGHGLRAENKRNMPKM